MSKYNYIYFVSNRKRPYLSTLESKFENLSKEEYSKVQNLAYFWDELFPNQEKKACTPEVAKDSNHKTLSEFIQAKFLSSKPEGEDPLKDKVEEWVEDATLLKEALSSLDGVFVCDSWHRIAEEFGEMPQIPYIGHIPGRNPHFYEKTGNLDDDLLFPELKEFLGREIITAKADYNNMKNKVFEMLQKYNVIYLKWLSVNKVRSVIPIKSLDDFDKWFFADPFMVETLHRCELSIQEGLELTHEHRFFVVNGKIVTSSPTRWDLTPIHKIEPIDEVLQTNFENFVAEVVDSLKNGTSLQGQTYVVDVAWDKKYNRVVVVELNPIHNSGLYNCDVKKIIQVVKEEPNEFELKW